MTGWLLDTDVLSVFAPGKPAVPREIAARFEARSERLFLSAITAAEIVAGIAKLQRSGARQRADGLRAWFERIVEWYGDRILPFDLRAARIAGVLGDEARARGRHPGFADVAMAAIARSNDLAVLTLNLRHFEPLGVAAANPFDGDD
ncbi:MAG TPA: PIN domain-containing protein [Stellaceae bacterium]|nr:PIN domain-containing protein [Stellaceae bacterium]